MLFSFSERRTPSFEATFFTSSSVIPRTATSAEPHSGHAIKGAMSFNRRISAYFQQLVHASVLTSFRILALVELTSIWFIFSVGIISALRLILSRPILEMGLASPVAVIVLT